MRQSSVASHIIIHYFVDRKRRMRESLELPAYDFDSLSRRLAPKLFNRGDELNGAGAARRRSRIREGLDMMNEIRLIDGRLWREVAIL